jgi:hypothetical protein
VIRLSIPTDVSAVLQVPQAGRISHTTSIVTVYVCGVASLTFRKTRDVKISNFIFPAGRAKFEPPEMIRRLDLDRVTVTYIQLKIVSYNWNFWRVSQADLADTEEWYLVAKERK